MLVRMALWAAVVLVWPTLLSEEHTGLNDDTLVGREEGHTQLGIILSRRKAKLHRGDRLAHGEGRGSY